MLTACSEVIILVTSRELLRLPQERAYFLEGLIFVDQDTPVVSTEESAVALFIERAQKVEKINLSTDSGLNQIRQICGLVEGLPLAIEAGCGPAASVYPWRNLLRTPQISGCT